MDLPKSGGPRAGTMTPYAVYQFHVIRQMLVLGERRAETYTSPALENDRFFARSLAICECAYCLSGLVVKCGEEFVEILYSERLEEPFSAGSISL